MPAMRPQTALILGNGLSGYGAACVLASAGWRVILAEPASDKALAARYLHGHVIAESVLRCLDRLTGAQPAWDSVDALYLTAQTKGSDAQDALAHDRILRPMALVAPDGLRAAQMARADMLGVERCDARALAPDADRWRFTANGVAAHADLLIDASGTGQALARLPGVNVVQEEMAERDVCYSWTGQASPTAAGRGAAGGGDAFLLLARGLMGCDSMLARFPDGRVTMTTRGCYVPPMPQLLLDTLLLASDAAWAQRLGTIRFPHMPARYSAPLARITEFANADALPPVMLIGDALLQTAPRFGQGVANLTRQLHALSHALDRGDCLRALASDWQQQASAQWAALAITAPFHCEGHPIAA